MANIVKLTLAFRPSASLRKRISLWIKDKIGVSPVLEISVDPKILGGAIISANGYYQDLSLKKKIKEQINLISNYSK